MRNTRARLMVVLLMGACLALLGCEDDNDNDGNSQVQGTWTGVVTASGSSIDDTVTFSVSFTFDGNGNVTSFVGGPPTTSLSGSIAVASDDSVSGTLHSTHNTQYGVETTVWQWSGRLVSANQMTVSIVAQWSNTSGSNGSYLVSGTLTRQ